MARGWSTGVCRKVGVGGCVEQQRGDKVGGWVGGVEQRGGGEKYNKY